MDMERWGPVLTVLGVIATGLMAWFGQRAVSRASVQVREITNEVELEKVADSARNTDRAAFESIVTNLRTELDRAMVKIDRLEKHEELRDQRERERDARDEAQRTVLMVHSGWDWNVLDMARRASPPLNVPDPPPLTPPNSIPGPALGDA